MGNIVEGAKAKITIDGVEIGLVTDLRIDRELDKVDFSEFEYRYFASNPISIEGTITKMDGDLITEAIFSDPEPPSQYEALSNILHNLGVLRLPIPHKKRRVWNRRVSRHFKEIKKIIRKAKASGSSADKDISGGSHECSKKQWHFQESNDKVPR